jgi:predicted TIM-barrel fold metal-dependent hydrolase
VGRRFIEEGLSLGVPNFAVHKGLPIPGFDVEHNYPWDIGPAAKDYPEANIVVYHSAIGASYGDGATDVLGFPSTETKPYDATSPREMLRGTDTLIRSLIDAGIGPGGNVYAELGSAWSNVMRSAVDSQHFIGKLLKHAGEDNICWGTDCILGGSPQAQIEAVRAFTNTPEFQATYGYPELTPAIKKKIFGLNAAKFYRVDPDKARCKVEASEFAMIKRELDHEIGPRRWTAKPPLGPTSRREFLNLARANRAKGQPG